MGNFSLEIAVFSTTAYVKDGVVRNAAKGAIYCKAVGTIFMPTGQLLAFVKACLSVVAVEEFADGHRQNSKFQNAQVSSK